MKWRVSRSMGWRYQVIMAVLAARRTRSPPVTVASLVTSHRVRGTVWAQASCQVPYSSSLAISGAPMTTPISPGNARSSAQNPMLTTVLKLVMKAATAPWQAPVTGFCARHPASWSWLNAVRMELLTTIANTARMPSSPRQVMAWLRCCRQLTQIIALPPSWSALAAPRPGQDRLAPPLRAGAAGGPAQAARSPRGAALATYGPQAMTACSYHGHSRVLSRGGPVGTLVLADQFEHHRPSDLVMRRLSQRHIST